MTQSRCDRGQRVHSIPEQFGDRMQSLDVLRDDADDHDDGNAEQHPPDAPQPAPEQQRNEDGYGFIRAIRPVIQVVTNVPTNVAIVSDAPATSRAAGNESNCMNAAMAVTPAVTAGPR